MLAHGPPVRSVLGTRWGWREIEATPPSFPPVFSSWPSPLVPPPFPLPQVLAWAEHHLGGTTGHTHVTPPDLPHPPAPPSSTASTSTPPRNAPPALPHRPRPQSRVPQRASASRRVQPPPSHVLSLWEREFIAKNRDDVYELLLASLVSLYTYYLFVESKL